MGKANLLGVALTLRGDSEAQNAAHIPLDMTLYITLKGIYMCQYRVMMRCVVHKKEGRLTHGV